MHYRFPPHFAFNHDYRLSGPAATVELRSVQKTFSNREAYVVPEYLLFVPLRGQKTFYEGIHNHTVEPGQCLLIRKHAWLTCDVTRLDDGAFEAIMLVMRPEFIAHTLHKYPLKLPTTPPIEDNLATLTTTPLLQSAIESLLPFFMQDTAHHQALIQLKMEELLLHLLSPSAYQAEALGILGDVLFQPRAAYLPLIQACLHTPMTIEAMAQQVGQSPTVFKREFKAAFGLPPARYLQEKRLEHAHLMLLNTAKSVTDIAMETGFDSASHFTQAFKKHYGLTPGTLRKSRPNTP
jgi:AraC-like DNA-binding protein